MNNERNGFYIITGGPGVGKTTLINQLQQAGFLTIEEEARKIIKQQVAIGGDGLPWKDKPLYAQLMLDASIATFEETNSYGLTEPVFFDRGILDAVCYMRMENIPISKEIVEVVNKCTYNRNVFILPPWKEIYQMDNERKQPWEEALFTFGKMKETYLLYGYDVIEVPKVSVLARQQFILEKTKQTL